MDAWHGLTLVTRRLLSVRDSAKPSLRQDLASGADTRFAGRLSKHPLAAVDVNDCTGNGG
jgi:hypothetical protein